MSSCSVELTTELEDFYPYLIEMENSNDDDEGISSQGDDVYTQLAQKERDLILAAELGKALLEKNEALTRQNEQLNEEYTQKFEELTQEKHGLKLRLESIEGEYSITVKELQNDIELLRRDLDETHRNSDEGDREKSHVLHELTQQNERLTDQLKKATYDEEQLQSQLHSLREQISTRRTNMHDHVHQLEVLREEITVLTDRKSELERRITILTEERDTMACNLEESQDRNMMIEKQKREQDAQLRSQEREINEIQEANNELQERVEELQLQTTGSEFNQSNSLFSELEMSQNSMTDNSDMELATRLSDQSGMKKSQNLSIHMIEEDDDDVECDDDITMGTIGDSFTDLSSFMGRSSSPSPHMQEENYQLKQEILELHSHLQRMVYEIKRNYGDACPEPQEAQLGDVKAGMLASVLEELRGVMQEVITKHMNTKADGATAQPGSPEEMDAKIKSLQKELEDSKDQLTMFKAGFDQKDKELKKKEDEMAALSNKITIQHQEMHKLQEERDRLQDQAAGTVGRDEVIEQARKDRDDATEKRNSMEVELAKAKLDVMNLDSQLMEAIQQKIELSQQLEQWQSDIEELIDNQLQQQIKQERSKSSSIQRGSPMLKRFNFWS